MSVTRRSVPVVLFGMPGGGHRSGWISGSRKAEKPRVGVFESFVGVSEQAPDPIEERISLATRVSKGLVLDVPAALV
jgi:hypothetical protein